MENYMGMEIDMLNEKLKEKDERIKEFESHLDEKDRRTKVLEDIIEHYRRTINYNNNAFTKLFNDKKELSEEIDKQAEILKEKDEKIENLRNYNVKLNRQITELYERIDKLHIVNLETEVLTSREKIEDLEKQIEEKDARIEQLKSENEGMAWTSLDNISDLKVKIKERDEWIENLKEENETLKKKLENKNKLIDYMRYKNGRLEEQVDKLNCDVSEKDETIKNLNKELASKTMELAAARISSGTRMGMMYIDSNIRVRAADEAFKAIDEAIKKLDEEIDHDE